MYAGIGTSGTTGDGGPATLAQIANPTGLSWSEDTNSLLIAEGNRVRAVNATGHIRRIIGSTSGSTTGDGGCVRRAMRLGSQRPRHFLM